MPVEARNRVYGGIYALTRPDHSGPRWGEENAFGDLQRLVTVLDAHGHLGREPVSCFVWEQWEQGVVRSHHYRLLRRPLDRGRAGFVNGVNSTPDGARWDASRLSDFYLEGRELHCVYNARGRAPWLNLALTSALHGGICTPPVRLLLEEWAHFFWTARPEEKFLQISFSQGAAIVRNALKFLDLEHRQRICVLSLCPASFIARSEGCEVVHIYKLEDPVLLAAEGFASSKHGRDMIDVSGNDGAHAHDPFGANYMRAIRPLVESWLRTGSFFSAEAEAQTTSAS